MRDAAPLDVLIGHAVIRNLDPGDEEEFAVAHNAVLPARHLAALVGSCLEALVGLRAEHPLCDVLLACPDKLDRLAHLFGDERAFRSVVADGAAAEGAAHVALVEVHLLDVETKRLRHCLA